MTSAFCPAHITCFFRPAVSDGILESGSRGVGIRLRSGTIVHVEEIRGETKIFIDGKKNNARITKYVLEHMAPGRCFEVNAECGVPPGQGFGMSASGAVAAALCMSEITGKSRTEAFEMAHAAEVVCGGGLGDVSGLMHEGDVPIRIKAGLPPRGQVTDAGIPFERMTLVVLGKKLSTAGVLGNDAKVKRLCEAGDAAMDSFLKDTSKDALLRISNEFSSESQIRGSMVDGAMRALENKGIRSSMCMLGNSIFTDASEDEVRAVLKDEEMIFCSASTAEPAHIIRKA